MTSRSFDLARLLRDGSTTYASTTNTANTIVARDASGNFSGGTITATLNGNASTATVATTLQTARTIAISGDVTGTGTSFNGGSNITISSAITANSIVNADINTSAAIEDTKLSTIITAGKVSNSATTATSANTANAIVARDASGNFSAGSITVSGTVDGRDLAVDGAKLDGIESGATADQTAAEILTLIQTVDGASSGLDADLLDGYHATSFYLATNPSGYTTNTGTVTSVATSGAITGGTITTTGTISHSTADGYLHVPATGTTNSGKVLTAGSTAGSFSWQTPSGGGGGGITFIKKTTTYTASAGEGIIADTTGGAWTLTLPASPSLGNQVVVADGGGWAAANLTVARNGSTIESTADDYLLDVSGSQVQFLYDGSTWQIYSNPGIVHSSDSLIVYNSAGTVLKTIYSA